MTIMAVESKAIDSEKATKDIIQEDNPADNAQVTTLLAYVKAHPAEVKEFVAQTQNPDSAFMKYVKAHPEQVKKFMSEVKEKGPAIKAYIKAHPGQVKKFMSALQAQMAQGNLGLGLPGRFDVPADNPEKVKDSLAKFIRDILLPVKDVIRSVRRRLAAKDFGYSCGACSRYSSSHCTSISYFVRTCAISCGKC